MAAKLAFVHELISSLPNSYETVVDDELLSGGQKQRIAIARAILRDPAILILDEATTALDAESEYNIKDILHGFRNDMNGKRTIIVITHRLSTIRAAHGIIVMKGGQVVEMGGHIELLSEYRRIPCQSRKIHRLLTVTLQHDVYMPNIDFLEENDDEVDLT